MEFLKTAKSYGDFLIVVVANDKTVLKNKGVLLYPADGRKRLVESIGFVDKAVVGDEKDFFRVVETEKPDIIVLGYDQTLNRDELKKRMKKIGLNCRVVRVRKKLRGYGTRSILDKVNLI